MKEDLGYRVPEEIPEGLPSTDGSERRHTCNDGTPEDISKGTFPTGLVSPKGVTCRRTERSPWCSFVEPPLVTDPGYG